MVNKLHSLGIQIYLSEIIRLYNKGNVITRETMRCSGAHFLHNLNDVRIFDFQSSISENSIVDFTVDGPLTYLEDVPINC